LGKTIESIKCSQIIEKFSQVAKKKYGLELTATGLGTDDGIKVIITYFNRYGKPIGIDASRVIAVKYVQEFLQMINNDPDLKTYLKYYPFKVKHLEFCIGNLDKRGNRVFDPFVESIAIVEGIIRYTLVNKDHPTTQYDNDITETYEEALEILKKNNENHGINRGF